MPRSDATVRRTGLASFLSSVVFALTGGCGESVRHDVRAVAPQAAIPIVHRAPQAPADASPRPRDAAPDAVPPAAPAPSPLHNSAALRRFYEALAHLDDRAASDDVRIVQFGDSHTAADMETGAVRRALQTRFGDGGRGFVAIGRPYAPYVQDAVRAGMSREWLTSLKPPRGRPGATDGCYGLSGSCILGAAHGGRAWVDVAAPTARIEVSYLEQPAGGSFEVYVDDVRKVRIATRSRAVTSAFRAIDVPEASHHVEVRTGGDGAVRLFGVALDRPTAGVTLDALGINGARVTTALGWNEAHMADQLRHRDPDLVIVAYGTNESGDDTPKAVYERQVVDLLGRVSRATPAAACLLLGPPDRAILTPAGWATSPKLVEIVESQRAVAEAAGCAFYDQLQAMGGPGTIAAWADQQPPRARRDRVHLLREGYTQLGEAFAAEIERSYAAWRTETGRPPAAPPADPTLISSREARAKRTPTARW